MIQGKDREESIKLTAEALGITEREATFIVAMELGEIDGDVIEVDEKYRDLVVDQVQLKAEPEA
jgi:hypothetical protein